MSEAANRLNLLGGKRRGKHDPPTKDHLPPEDGPAPKQSPAPQQVSNGEPRSGSFEKLSAMFGSAGAMFALPPGAR